MSASDPHGGGTDAGLAEGLARVAAAWGALPAHRTAALAPDEGEAAATLAAGWNLLGFSLIGELLAELLDAGGARVELVRGVPATWGSGRRGHGGGCCEGAIKTGAGGEGGDRACEEGRAGARIPRATSHGPAAAAWGAPPGRRATAMGLVPGPDGALLRASCALVLRLPQQAVVTAERVVHMLAFHGAMYAAERRALPAPPRLDAALAALSASAGMPAHPSEHVAWAIRLAAHVGRELGFELPCARCDVTYSGH